MSKITLKDIREEFFHEYRETNCRVQDDEGNFPEEYLRCEFIGDIDMLMERIEEYTNQKK